MLSLVSPITIPPLSNLTHRFSLHFAKSFVNVYASTKGNLVEKCPKVFHWKWHYLCLYNKACSFFCCCALCDCVSNTAKFCTLIHFRTVCIMLRYFIYCLPPLNIYKMENVILTRKTICARKIILIFTMSPCFFAVWICEGVCFVGGGGMFAENMVREDWTIQHALYKFRHSGWISLFRCRLHFHFHPRFTYLPPSSHRLCSLYFLFSQQICLLLVFMLLVGRMLQKTYACRFHQPKKYSQLSCCIINIRETLCHIKKITFFRKHYDDNVIHYDAQCCWYCFLLRLVVVVGAPSYMFIQMLFCKLHSCQRKHVACQNFSANVFLDKVMRSVFAGSSVYLSNCLHFRFW